MSVGIVAFAIGMALGSAFGFLAGAVLAAGGDADERMGDG